MSRSRLETQLEEITRDFVARIVEAVKEASIGDVAELEIRKAAEGPSPGRQKPPAPKVPPSRQRQTAGRRAEVGTRVLEALRKSSHPLGLRALAQAVGVPRGALAAPLRELRASGRLIKHGERRTTTYSAAG